MLVLSHSYGYSVMRLENQEQNSIVNCASHTIDYRICFLHKVFSSIMCSF